jgi:hypothetical protein
MGIIHKLINVTYEGSKKVRKWSGECSCRRWVGAGNTEKALKSEWIRHVNDS